MDRDFLRRKLALSSQNIFQSAADLKYLAPLLRHVAAVDPLPVIRGYSGFIADGFCMAGKVELGTEIMEANILKLIAVIQKNGSVQSLSLADVFFAEKTSYTREEKLNGLDSILKVVSQVTDKPFLSFGTLLGFVRERDFIAHDMDIDIGLMAPEVSCPELKNLLVAEGFKIVLYEGPTWPCRIYGKTPVGIPFDLVFFQPDGDKLLTYMRYLNHLLIRRRTLFKLEKVDFWGRSVWIPSPPEIFLDENYGNWHQPSGYHDCILTSKLTDFSMPIVRYAARKQFFRLCTKVQMNKAKALLDLVMGIYPDDPFWEKVLASFPEKLIE